MNTNVPDSDLSRHLAHRADEFDRRGGSPLDISQVLDRAGEIKRGRRMRATMVMAAAVLAVAVPTALIATKGNTDKPVTPAHHVKVDTSPLSLESLDHGDPPRTGYVQDGVWQGPTGDIGLHGGRVVDVAAMTKGLLVAISNDETGDLTARYFGVDKGTIAQTWPMEGGFVVSESGNAGAFVEPDGTPVVVFDEGRGIRELPKIPAGSGFDAVAVTGDTCAESGSGTCEVLVTSHGKRPQTWVSTSTSFVGEYEQMSNVVDLVDQRLVAGMTEVHDDLSTCSAVKGLDPPAVLWSTCEHRFDSFSPDGRLLLAMGSVGSGFGETQLAVLDAETGEPVLDLRTAGQGSIYDMVWEDDTHVIATVYEDGKWAVLRIGVNGHREYAIPPREAVDDIESPFVLPSR